MSKLIILLKLKKKQSTARRVAKLSATTTTTRKNVKLTQSALALNTTFVSSLSPPQKSSSTSSIILSTKTTVSSKSFLQSADLSDTTNAATQQQQVFNQLEKSRFYSFLNSTSKLNTSDTLEQMYNDNNTFNESFRSSSSSSSSSNTSTSSMDTNQKFEITSTNVDSTSSQLNVKLKSILKPYNVDDINIDVSTTQPLISNISILKLEQEIRKRINELRQTAATLSLNVPVNLSMLEAMYDLKMDGLKHEARKAIKEFDQKSAHHERHGNMNLNKFFRLIKNLNGKSLRRARSLNSSPNRQSKVSSSPLSTPEIKHKNYYSFERDNIERKMESRMRSFQYEILFLINDIEAQFKQLKRASRDEAAKAKNASCARHQARVNQRRKTGTLTKKQRIHYSTEAIIQKRIRIHKCQYAYDKNNNSVQNLTTTELIEKNKNPLAFETMV